MPDADGIVCLTRGQSIGLTLGAEAGIISIAALVGIAVLIFIRSGFQRQIGLLMLELLFSDIIMALGSLINIKWLLEGELGRGNYCSAQGIIQQLGGTGNTILTIIVTYTFATAVWERPKGQREVTCPTFAFTLLRMGTILGTQIHGLLHYPTAARFCWIGMGPYNQRYAAEYIWMWGAISVSAITYALASFMPKGVCISQGDAHMQRQNRRLTIILYAAVYFITTVPLSFSRWLSSFRRATMLTSAANLSGVEVSTPIIEYRRLDGVEVSTPIFAYRRLFLYTHGNDVYDSVMYAQPLEPITAGYQYATQDTIDHSPPSHCLRSEFDTFPDNMNALVSIIRLNASSQKHQKNEPADRHPPSYLPSLDSVKREPFLDVAFPPIHGNDLNNNPLLSPYIVMGIPTGNQCAYDMRWMPFMQYQGFPPVTG